MRKWGAVWKPKSRKKKISTNTVPLKYLTFDNKFILIVQKIKLIRNTPL